ncbi:unknown [Clostridium sp. CAG:768]|jgi:prepilin-type N-terminal cleavage/methylation domain-containing protein|nr:unknown [Clostridium sp. CAG:768]
MRTVQAFTLAEVLITLGIIGVVAAMTLPTLINDKRNKELEAGFKKAYSIIQTAFNKMSYDEGQIINNENYPSLTFAPKFKTYFKDTYSDITINSGDYKSYTNGFMNLSWFDDGRIMLSDGMLIMIESPYKSGKLYITVDVNGLKKRPNRWGYDLFTFQVTNDGKLLPGGAVGTDMDSEEFCSKSNKTSIYNGFGCAYRAIAENDYFKKLPK